MIIAIVAIFYIICGVLSHAIMFGYFYNRFPEGRARNDFILCASLSLLGPFTLIASLLFCWTEGWEITKENLKIW